MTIEINIEGFYSINAKLSELDLYIQKAKDLAGEGNDVVLTGQGPIWLPCLHQKRRRRTDSYGDEWHEDNNILGRRHYVNPTSEWVVNPSRITNYTLRIL